MTTFRPSILQCPNCKANMFTFELTSFTVHSSIVYSDGKVDNSSSLSDKQILICNDCRKPMWRDDAILNDSDINYETLPEAKDVFDLPFAFDTNRSNKLAFYYTDLLNDDFADTSEKEIYLRIKIWHLLNNSSRNTKQRGSIKEIIDKNISSELKNSDEKSTKFLFDKNLEHLTKIYKPDCDEQQLLYAEMFRELGDFNEAKLQLNKINNLYNNSAYKQIAKMIKTKKSNVIKIT